MIAKCESCSRSIKLPSVPPGKIYRVSCPHCKVDWISCGDLETTMDYLLEGTPYSKHERQKRAYWERVKSRIFWGWLIVCAIIAFNDLASGFYLLFSGFFVMLVSVLWEAGGYQSDGE